METGHTWEGQWFSVAGAIVSLSTMLEGEDPAVFAPFSSLPEFRFQDRAQVPSFALRFTTVPNSGLRWGEKEVGTLTGPHEGIPQSDRPVPCLSDGTAHPQTVQRQE